jgi:hypothetical protein
MADLLLGEERGNVILFGALADMSYRELAGQWLTSRHPRCLFTL